MAEKALEKYRTAQCSPVEDKGENLEGDVNIQCLQSSEFVVGKQHNFNGPVTIINCAETTDWKPLGDTSIQMNEEKIIIRDKVLSPVQKMTEGSSVEKNQESEPESQKKKKWYNLTLEKLSKYSKTIIFLCVGILIVITIILGVFFATINTAGDTLMIGNNTFYTKQDWGGKPPTLSIEMKLPVPYVVVSHTVTTRCYNLKGCGARLRNMQEYHFTLNFSDISYNFLLDSSGNIYEGRGWKKRNIMGGFVNGRSIDVALIGDYSQNTPPSDEIMDGLSQLLEYGVENGMIHENYTLLAANLTYATLSPGKNVYAIIKDWPHFDPDPKSHIWKED